MTISNVGVIIIFDHVLQMGKPGHRKAPEKVNNESEIVTEIDPLSDLIWKLFPCTFPYVRHTVFP